MRKSLSTIALFEFRENIRNKWLFVYGVVFFLFSGLITYMGGSDPIGATASLLNLVLLLVPLFSLVFGSISFSESLPFHQMLVSLPITRKDIYWGKLLGLGTGLSSSYLIGMGLGSLLQLDPANQGLRTYFLLLVSGVLLTFIFLSIAFVIVVLSRRRELLFGWMLILWFFFFVLYDALIMGITLLLQDYPLEWPLFFFILTNPIDLVRVFLMLHMDLAAMMGISGALFQKYLGSSGGVGIAGFILLAWALIPAWLGCRFFSRKDL